MDGLLNMIFHRELTIEEFYLEKPQFKIHLLPPLPDTNAILQDPKSAKFDHRNLNAHIKDYLALLSINYFEIIG